VTGPGLHVRYDFIVLVTKADCGIAAIADSDFEGEFGAIINDFIVEIRRGQ